MNQKALNVMAGLLVPAFATIVFNALTHLVEKGSSAAIPPTIFDFSFGCTFTIVGMAAANKVSDQVMGLFLAFVLLLLFLMGVNIVLGNYLSADWKPYIIWSSNVVALGVVAVAIWRT